MFQTFYNINHSRTDKQNTTGKYTNEIQLKSNAKYIKTILPWFSRLLRHL